MNSALQTCQTNNKNSAPSIQMLTEKGGRAFLTKARQADSRGLLKFKFPHLCHVILSEAKNLHRATGILHPNRVTASRER
jgi:hypothetical protein